MFPTLLAVALFLLFACSSSNAAKVVQTSACDDQSGTNSTNSAMPDEAHYKLTVSINWATATTGTSPIPGGAHFTTVTGTNHRADYAVWATGTRATAGLETLAETGVTGTLSSEIMAKIGAGSAQQVISLSGTGAVGSSEKTLLIRRSLPLLSLASMLAPSSDWFTGVSCVSLLDNDGNWRSSLERPLHIYDAGTEDDTNLFNLGNADASPKVNIQRLTGSNTAQGGVTVGFVPPKDVVGTLKIERITQ